MRLALRLGLTRGLALTDKPEQLAATEAWLRQVERTLKPAEDQARLELALFGRVVTSPEALARECAAKLQPPPGEEEASGPDAAAADPQR